MNWVGYPNRDALMQALAAAVAGQLRDALATHPRVTLSVPGGTTPGPVFDLLAQTELAWDRVDVLLNDERWVGEDSPRSNTALVRARLLRGCAAPARLIPLYLPAPTPEDRLEEVSAGVRAVLPLTVLILGMGADMHTASLFPGADQLHRALSDTAPPVMALRADAAGEPRITLTAPVLRAATHCHLVITGAEKRSAVGRAETLPEAEAPVRVVLPRATIHWAP